MLKHITAALGADRPPVRRGSHQAGTCERGWYRAVTRQDGNRLVLAARRYERATRGKGQRNGALGHIGLEVLAYLVALADRRTGRLEPSLRHLMAQLRRSRAAVVRALAALKAHGFLDWRRRWEPAPREGRGPQIRQTSNAYRLSLPPRAAQLVPAPPPPPDVEGPEKVLAEDEQRLRDALAVMEGHVLAASGGGGRGIQ